MAKKAMGTPPWNEKEQRWRLQKMKDGKRGVFYSSDPSPRKGPAECRRKCEEWLEELELGKQQLRRLARSGKSF